MIRGYVSLIVGFLLLSTSVLASAQSGKVPPFPTGKVVPVILDTALNSATAHKGNTVDFHIEYAVNIDGYDYLPQDARLTARISAAHAVNAKHCTVGYIRFSRQEVVTGNGKLIGYYTQEMPRDSNGNPLDVLPPPVPKHSSAGSKAAEAAGYVALSPLYAAMVPFGIVDTAARIALSHGNSCGSQTPAAKDEVLQPGQTMYLILGPSPAARRRSHPSS